MLRGLTTVSFYADNVSTAKDWYAQLLGIEPYFTRSMGDAVAYVEFRVGENEDELGIIDSRFAPARSEKPGGAVVYWHVDDPRVTFERLIAMGATAYEEPVERGPGFVTASVVDPFGNVLGVMYNQHYAELNSSADRVR